MANVKWGFQTAICDEKRSAFWGSFENHYEISAAGTSKLLNCWIPSEQACTTSCGNCSQNRRLTWNLRLGFLGWKIVFRCWYCSRPMEMDYVRNAALGGALSESIQSKWQWQLLFSPVAVMPWCPGVVSVPLPVMPLKPQMKSNQNNTTGNKQLLLSN